MWISPTGVTGPRFAKHIHDVPNRQPRMTSSYHDHALGISRLNVYAGLVGFYFITSQREEHLNLPDGEYDAPLMLHDRSFNTDGSLHYPDSFKPNVAGDTAVINGAVWPYLEVEPRRYRLWFLNTSNGRTYNLHLENDDGTDVPTLHQFAAGYGFLERVVPIGPDGDLESLVLSPFERGDVVVDFSDYGGETFTVRNDAPFPFAGLDHTGGNGGHSDHGGTGPELHELMQIRLTFGIIGLLIVVVFSPVLFGNGGISLGLVGLAIPLGLIITIISGLVYGFTTMFVVPAITIEDRGVISAWRQFWPTMTGQWKQYAAYAVVGFILRIAGGIVTSIATALGALVVTIPLGIVGLLGIGVLTLSQIAGWAVIAIAAVLFVVALILLVVFASVPVQTFLRYYALLVLSDTNETFDVIPRRRRTVRE